MVNHDGKTSIWIPIILREKLESLKEHPRSTYAEVIESLLSKKGAKA